MTESQQSTPVESLIKAKSGELFSETDIENYKEGCALLATNLNETVNRVLEAGKRPTILIPSRGALPNLLVGIDYLNRELKDDRFVNSRRVRYYPEGIFEYLSNNNIQKNEEREGIADNTEIDVVLYPFTADVSITADSHGEELAKELRKSCARAFSDLVVGDKSSSDLNWNFFLMQKLRNGAFSSFNSSSESLVKSLKSIPARDDRQIILVDTVISGRAAANITEAFAELGHPVVPVLAVSDEGRFQDKNKEKIRLATLGAIEFMDEGLEQHLHEYPLIAEDRGASLLGVAAFNFANFNNPQFFNAREGAHPLQSCIWVIPPEDYYIQLFKAFLDRCSFKDRKSNEWIRQWMIRSQEIAETIKHRNSAAEGKEVKEILQVKHPIGVTETSSHIMSIELDSQEAREWQQEFTRTIPQAA